MIIKYFYKKWYFDLAAYVGVRLDQTSDPIKAMFILDVQVFSRSSVQGIAAHRLSDGDGSIRPSFRPLMCFVDGFNSKTSSIFCANSSSFCWPSSHTISVLRKSNKAWVRTFRSRLPTVNAGRLFSMEASWEGWRKRARSHNRLRTRLRLDPSTPCCLANCPTCCNGRRTSG